MKVLKRIFAITLIISVLMSCVVINASASGSTYTEHTSCVNEHFAWVQDEANPASSKSARYPENNVGNCPFVAMSLLLSYYDAYWHDDFVPNNAENDFETIGVINTTTGAIVSDFHFALENDQWNNIYNKHLGYTDAEWRDIYGDFVEDYASDFFNLYLIYLAMNSNWGIYDLANTYGLTALQMVSFLEYYLYNIRGFSEEQVTVNKMSALLPNGRYDMFNKATQLINDGYPVLYCGVDTSLDEFQLSDPNIDFDNIIAGHVLLGYDTPNSDITLSQCWNNYDCTTFGNTEYKYISSIIWLEINPEVFPHVCSVSYVDANDPNRTFCTCEIYRNHPNHVDSINSGAEICPMGTSTATCLCGESIKNTHNYCYINHGNVQHWLECACGEKTNWEIHNKIYTQSIPSGHSGYCECGYEFTNEAHSLGNCVMTNASYHRGTCACGRVGSETHILQDDPMKAGVRKCSKCTYTKKITDGSGSVHLGIEDDTENEMS